jgi:hypothetical protein
MIVKCGRDGLSEFLQREGLRNAVPLSGWVSPEPPGALVYKTSATERSISTTFGPLLSSKPTSPTSRSMRTRLVGSGDTQLDATLVAS